MTKTPHIPQELDPESWAPRVRRQFSPLNYKFCLKGFQDPRTSKDTEEGTAQQKANYGRPLPASAEKHGSGNDLEFGLN